MEPMGSVAVSSKRFPIIMYVLMDERGALLYKFRGILSIIYGGRGGWGVKPPLAFPKSMSALQTLNLNSRLRARIRVLLSEPDLIKEKVGSGLNIQIQSPSKFELFFIN